MTAPALVLDFDGVVCDSTPECEIVAWNAWRSFRGSEPDVETEHRFKQLLRGCRGFVRTCGEYLVLARATEMEATIATWSDYEEILTLLSPREMAHFAACFVQARRALLQDEAHWLSLHKQYAGFQDKLKGLVKDFRLFVVTGKDIDSVMLYFSRMEIHLDHDCIRGGNAGNNKLVAVNELLSGHGIIQAAVLDDNIRHLIPIARAGLPAVLAAWGYVTPECRELARRNGIPMADLSDWETRIRSLLDPNPNE